MGYSVQSIGKWTNYTPTWTGFTNGSEPVVLVSRYTRNGNMCTVELHMTNGTSNSTSFSVTLPFNAANTVNNIPVFAANSGTGAFSRMNTTSGSNVLTFIQGTALTVTSWTNSGTKGASFRLTYECQ